MWRRQAAGAQHEQLWPSCSACSRGLCELAARCLLAVGPQGEPNAQLLGCAALDTLLQVVYSGHGCNVETHLTGCDILHLRGGIQGVREGGVTASQTIA